MPNKKDQTSFKNSDFYRNVWATCYSLEVVWCENGLSHNFIHFGSITYKCHNGKWCMPHDCRERSEEIYQTCKSISSKRKDIFWEVTFGILTVTFDCNENMVFQAAPQPEFFFRRFLVFLAFIYIKSISFWNWSEYKLFSTLTIRNLKKGALLNGWSCPWKLNKLIKILYHF